MQREHRRDVGHELRLHLGRRAAERADEVVDEEAQVVEVPLLRLDQLGRHHVQPARARGRRAAAPAAARLPRRRALAAGRSPRRRPEAPALQARAQARPLAVAVRRHEARHLRLAPREGDRHLDVVVHEEVVEPLAEVVLRLRLGVDHRERRHALGEDAGALVQPELLELLAEHARRRRAARELRLRPRQLAVGRRERRLERGTLCARGQLVVERRLLARRIRHSR